MLTLQVEKEIKAFIDSNWDSFIAEAKEYCGMDITFATNEEGDKWGYQTGDNSYTGGCYSLPHWSVCHIYDDMEAQDLFEQMLDGFESCV